MRIAILRNHLKVNVNVEHVLYFHFVSQNVLYCLIPKMPTCQNILTPRPHSSNSIENAT